MPLCRVCDNWVDEPVAHPVDCRHLRKKAEPLKKNSAPRAKQPSMNKH
jgi:hypothetical protein